MRKIINGKDNIVSQCMEGFVGAYRKYYEKHPKVNGVLYKNRRNGKVALVIGGGSGHEPMFSGFVGEGLADAAACGNIFASPDPKTVYETGKAVDSGQGVLFIYGCYAGDNLNFDMGEEFLNREGIHTAHVRVQDDVASAPKERREERRGIAGDVFITKIAGAACDCGFDLEKVREIAEWANRNTYTIGVATSSAQLPGVDEPVFELGEDEIEYGMGIHGEKGIKRTKWTSADELTEEMYRQLREDAGLKAKDKVCVLVNGLGSTSILELSIVFRKLKKLLEEDGIQIHDSDLNSYCTSQEMGGFSITFLKLNEELERYYDMPCYSPYYAKGSVEIKGNGKGGKEGSCPKANEMTSDAKRPDEKENEFPREAKPAGGRCETEERVKKEGAETEIPYNRKSRYDSLDARDCKQMLIYVAKKIIGEEPVLTRIDSETGDGDHGTGMKQGMEKVIEALEEKEFDSNVYDVFRTAGETMILNMGGASGVIFGNLFWTGSRDVPAEALALASELTGIFAAGLEEIQRRGNARVGDKTMVDTLSPAVDAMKAHEGGSLQEWIVHVEEAARKGAESTKELVAGFGRAKFLGERAKGYYDAGAVSTWLIFQGMKEFICGSPVCGW